MVHMSLRCLVTLVIILLANVIDAERSRVKENVLDTDEDNFDGDLSWFRSSAEGFRWLDWLDLL